MMLRFTATADMPKFLYRKGGMVQRSYSDGRFVKVLVDPLVLKHGDVVQFDAEDQEEKWAADWCLSNFPQNFRLDTPIRVVEPAQAPDGEE